MTLKQILVSTILFLFTGCFFGQNTLDFYKYKNYYSVGFGMMYNHPTITNNKFNIERAFTHDRSLTVYWHRLINKHIGTLFKFEWSTQSTRYKYTDTSGRQGIRSKFPYSNTGRFSLVTAVSYNFMASKKINLLLSFGPQFHLNKYTNPYDSTIVKYNGGLVTHNTRQAGFGFNLGLNIVYKVTDRLFIFLNPSYQRGFVKFREAIVGDLTRTSTLNYYGSGPSISIGITFRLKPYEEREE